MAISLFKLKRGNRVIFKDKYRTNFKDHDGRSRKSVVYKISRPANSLRGWVIIEDNNCTYPAKESHLLIINKKDILMVLF